MSQKCVLVSQQLSDLHSLTKDRWLQSPKLSSVKCSSARLLKPKCSFFPKILRKIFASLLLPLRKSGLQSYNFHKFHLRFFVYLFRKFRQWRGRGGGGGRMAPRVPTPPDFVAIGDKCHWMLTLWIIRKWTPREDQTLARANSFYPPPSGSM